MYEEIKKAFENNKMIVPLHKIVVNTNTDRSSIQVGSVNQTLSLGGSGFKWDANKCGQGIDITNGGFGVFLKEQAYVFRTVLADSVKFILFSL